MTSSNQISVNQALTHIIEACYKTGQKKVITNVVNKFNNVFTLTASYHDGKISSIEAAFLSSSNLFMIFDNVLKTIYVDLETSNSYDRYFLEKPEENCESFRNFLNSLDFRKIKKDVDGYHGVKILSIDTVNFFKNM